MPESSARTKAYAARRIFKESLNQAALVLISKSSLLPADLIEKAKLTVCDENLNSDSIVPTIPNNDNLSIEVVGSNWNKKIKYEDLNARQKENYNLLKLEAVLSDYGFDLLRLNDDWQGADCIANHIDGNTYLKIQLKGRLTVDKKYLEKDIYIAFRDESDWYLYPHDDFVEFMQKQKIAVDSSSWKEKGHYSWPSLSSNFKIHLQK